MIDQEALTTFNQLYEDTYEDILKYVVCHCSNIEDVHDMIQNIYIEILKRLEKNPNTVFNHAYIMGITKNKVNQYYRFHYKNRLFSFFSKKEDFSLLDQIPDSIDIERETIKQEDINFIWGFLKSKKIIIIKIFFLYYYQDMKIKDIATYLHISETNVKNYLYRTLNQLKQIMEIRGDENDK